MVMMLMMNTAKLGNRMSREGIFYLAGRNPGGGRGGKSIVLPSDLEQNDIWGSLSKMLFDFCFEILVNPLQAQTCFSLDPSYRRGRVYKLKFCLSVCLSVRHHFNISNLGPSNHRRIMLDPTHYASLERR